MIYDPDTEEEELEAAVRKSRQQDMKQKTTLAGPHRDDISFVVNGIDIRRFGSQGQAEDSCIIFKAFRAGAGQKDQPGCSGASAG